MMRELQDDFEPPVDPNGPPSKAMLFADFLVQWLEIAKSTVKLTTYSSYKGLCPKVKLFPTLEVSALRWAT